MPHLNDEGLSTLIDNELESETVAQARRHISECEICAKRLEQLRSASAVFKRSGLVPTPKKLKNGYQPRFNRTLVGVAASLAIILTIGLVLKRIMPNVFGNVQMLIMGAANTLSAPAK